MVRRLVELLQCPACEAGLSLHALVESMEPVQIDLVRPHCAEFCAAHDRPVTLQGADQYDCRACFQRDVREGFLLCRGCPLVFPIIAGVPRLFRHALAEYEEFFQQHSATLAELGRQDVPFTRASPTRRGSSFDPRSRESFSVQWERYRDEDRTWFKDDLSHRRDEFPYGLDLAPSALNGALILDAGCGNGRLTTSVASYGAEVVGLDFSRSVERAHERRREIGNSRAPFVHFVQGDIMEPPFKRQQFDHIHSSGVLHHTPDTWRAFASFQALVRPGGRVYVQLYRRRELWVRMINTPLRFFTTRLPVRLLFAMCVALVPVHRLLVLIVAYFRGEESPIRHARRREAAVSLFDHLSPRYQFRYSPEQVRARFEAAGLLGVKDVTLQNEARHMVAFVGTTPGMQSGCEQERRKPLLSAVTATL